MGKYTALANRIKELRQGNGHTQQDLSQSSGLSRSYISRLEMGDIALPSRIKLRSLATALGTGLDDLLQAAGFLDNLSPATDLPDIRSYLRRKYDIQDPRVLAAVETIVENVKGATSEGSSNGSSPRGRGRRRQTAPLSEEAGMAEAEEE